MKDLDKINVGISANDGSGDTLRDAFIKVNEYFTEVEQAIDSLDSVKVDVEELKTDNVLQKSDIANLKNKDTSQDAEITLLKQKDLAQDNRLATLESDVQGFVGDLSSVNGRIDNQATEIGNLKSKDTQQDNNILTINGKVASIESVNTNQGIEITALKTKDISQDAKITALEGKDVSQDARMLAIEAKNSSQDTAINNLSLKNSEQDGRIEAIENDESGNTGAITNLDSKVNVLEGEITSLKSKDTAQDTRISNVEGVNATQSTDIASLKNKDVAQDSKISALESTVGGHTSDIANLKAKDLTQDGKITSLEERGLNEVLAVGNVAQRVIKGVDAVAPEDLVTKRQLDANSGTGTVKSVNNIGPTGNGNVVLPMPDLTPYATKQELNVKIGTTVRSVNNIGPDSNGNVNVSGGGGGGIPDAPVDGKTYGRRNASWAEVGSGGGIPDAPIDGKAYNRKDGTWSEAVDTASFATKSDILGMVKTVNGAGADSLGAVNIPVGIGDAPNDGKEYVRKDLNWVESTGGGSGDIPTLTEVVDSGHIVNSNASKRRYIQFTQEGWNFGVSVSGEGIGFPSTPYNSNVQTTSILGREDGIVIRRPGSNDKNFSLNINKEWIDSLGKVKTINGNSPDASGNINVSGGDSYTLPTATASTLGGVKIGKGINVDANGIISVPSSTSYTLPTASASTLGGIMIGDGLSIDTSGKVSVEGISDGILNYDSTKLSISTSGTSASNVGRASVGIGRTSRASGENSIAIGVLAKAIGRDSLALGSGTSANANYSRALGDGAVVNSFGAFVLGVSRSEADKTLETTKVQTSPRFLVASGDNSQNKGNDLFSVLNNGKVLAPYSTVTEPKQLTTKEYVDSLVSGAGWNGELTAPNGDRYKITVNNNGSLVSTKII